MSLTPEAEQANKFIEEFTTAVKELNKDPELFMTLCFRDGKVGISLSTVRCSPSPLVWGESPVDCMMNMLTALTGAALMAEQQEALARGPLN